MCGAAPRLLPRIRADATPSIQAVTTTTLKDVHGPYEVHVSQVWSKLPCRSIDTVTVKMERISGVSSIFWRRYMHVA